MTSNVMSLILHPVDPLRPVDQGWHGWHLVWYMSGWSGVRPHTSFCLRVPCRHQNINSIYPNIFTYTSADIPSFIIRIHENGKNRYTQILYFQCQKKKRSVPNLRAQAGIEWSDALPTWEHDCSGPWLPELFKDAPWLVGISGSLRWIHDLEFMSLSSWNNCIANQLIPSP